MMWVLSAGIIHIPSYSTVRTSDVVEQHEHEDADDEDNKFEVDIVDGIDGTVNCRNNRLLIRCNRRPIRRLCLSKSSSSSSSSFLIWTSALLLLIVWIDNDDVICWSAIWFSWLIYLTVRCCDGSIGCRSTWVHWWVATRLLVVVLLLLSIAQFAIENRFSLLWSAATMFMMQLVETVVVVVVSDEGVIMVSI